MMAPFPVVSIMNSLWVSPPDTLRAPSPACEAMSSKWTSPGLTLAVTVFGDWVVWDASQLASAATAARSKMDPDLATFLSEITFDILKEIATSQHGLISPDGRQPRREVFAATQRLSAVPRQDCRSPIQRHRPPSDTGAASYPNQLQLGFRC